MKRFTREILIGCFVMLVAFNASAQKQKIGHFDREEIFLVMPEYDSTRLAVESYAKSLDEQYKYMVMQYQSTKNEYAKYYNSPDTTLPQFALNIYEEKIGGLEQKITKLQQESPYLLQQYEAEQIAKLNDKINEAVKVVAKREGFAYVLDFSSGAIAYYEGGIDMTMTIRKELGIPENAVPADPNQGQGGVGLPQGAGQ